MKNYFVEENCESLPSKVSQKTVVRNQLETVKYIMCKLRVM